MAVTWELKTEVINVATDLRKVVAVRTDDVAVTSHTFFAKGCMKEPEEQQKIEDIIYNQWLAVQTKASASDPVADTLKTNLEAREVK